MDFNALIVIIIAIVAIYLFVKLVVSPIIKIILGVIIFIVAIYLLQKYFGFDSSKILGPLKLNWILGPVNYYIGQIKIFLNYIWGNFPKPSNQ